MVKNKREVVADKKRDIEMKCAAEEVILRASLDKTVMPNPFAYSMKVKEVRQACILKRWLGG